jgi:hypothetical protein
MRDYNRFVNAALENPLLRSSNILEEFINKNQNDFHIIKLKYKNLPKNIVMKDFISLTGELDATFYQDKYNLSINIQKIIEKKRNLFLNLHNAVKEVITQFEILDTKMNNLSHAFYDLSNEYKNNFENEKYFENLGNFCKNLSDIYSKEKNFFTIDIKEYFKYMRLEYDELDKLFNEYKYAKIIFEGHENNLNTYEKNKINNNEEIYKIELQKKKVEKDNAKRVCCFLQNRACDEYKRMVEAHEKRIKKAFQNSNIIETYQKEYDNILNLINNLAN